MKNTLIVVDMQNDFIDGSLGTVEAQAIVENVAQKIASYREKGDVIIFTRDTHQENYMETNEGKHLPVPHCIEGTAGWEISSALVREKEDLVIDKPSFGFVDWAQYLPAGIEEIELIGLCTDICVVSNALILKALFPEANVSVDASCCAGVTPETHLAALSTMKMCQVNILGE